MISYFKSDNEEFSELHSLSVSPSCSKCLILMKTTIEP
jgi:hypothetical protein